MLIPISKACDVLGVCAKTLYRWERGGYIVPHRTPGNHRRYDYDALVEFRESCVYDPQPEQKTGVAAVYARVSSNKQREDLARQVDFQSERARKDGFRVKVYSDIGSGLIALVTSFAGKIHRRRKGKNKVAPAGEAPVPEVAPVAIEH